ncbi:hypothetical protein ACS0TY_021576 [Phlomoides rotata]
MFVTTLWVAWFARNKLYFEDKVLDPQFLLALVSSQLEDFQKAKIKIQAPDCFTGGCMHRWKPPDPGYVKINSDASLIAGVGVAVGGVARNDRGEVQWCFSEMSPYTTDVELAEAVAILRAFEIASSKGVRKAIFETDAQVVYFALSRPQLNFSYFGSIVADILGLKGGLNDISFSWVRRSGNTVAHKLASLAFSRVVPVLSDSIPSELNEYINQWRRWSTSAINVLEFQYWNDGHISTVGGYISDLSTTCDFPELPCAKLLPTNIWWKWEPHLVLLYHKAADLTSKELRSLLTILGDISWMLCDSHEYDAEYQNLLGEFEAAANQAGGFVY